MDEKLVEFDKIYWLSQPPEVRALQINTTPDQDIRMGRGIELAIKGFKIDVPIMLWGWDPYKVMKLRMEFEFPLKDAAEAHRALEGRKTTGKVLLIP